jgi:hypothetical protein
MAESAASAPIQAVFRTERGNRPLEGSRVLVGGALFADAVEVIGF